MQSTSTNSDSAAASSAGTAATAGSSIAEPAVVESEAVETEFAEPSSEPEPALEIPPGMWRWLWIAACAAILLGAAFIRFYKLELAPLHHDEGVNGFFLTNLYRDHVYHYDPENYHGPTLYYFALVSVYIFGLTTIAIRTTTALFGLATIWLILTLRKQIGTAGALTAAVFMAVSPGAVYFSRYFIHETLFAFFTLGVIVYWLKYKSDPWPGYLVVTAIMAALLFSTKETAVINAVGIVLAGIATSLYFSLRKKIEAKWMARRLNKSDGGSGAVEGEPLSAVAGQAFPAGATQPIDAVESDPVPAVARQRISASNKKVRKKQARTIVVSNAQDRWPTWLVWGIAIAVLLFVFVLMYSSVFTYARGVKDAFRAFSFWGKTGRTGHVHAWNAYIKWLWEEETPLLVLGGVGIIVSLWFAANRFAVFMSLLSLALLIGYSMVPYKTPWLILTAMVMLAISAGCGIQAFYERSKAWEKALCIALIIAPAGFLLRQSIELNFYHYDDDNYAYVYAHTRREIFGLLDQVAEIAQRSGKGDDLGITITSPEYWPLPWYFRNYKNAAFFGQMANRGDLVVIGQSDQDAELQKMLGDSYIQLGYYTLRPGVDLVIYAKHDIQVQAPAPQ